MENPVYSLIKIFTLKAKIDSIISTSYHLINYLQRITPSDDAMDFITLVQQKFCKVRAILTSYAGY